MRDTLRLSYMGRVRNGVPAAIRGDRNQQQQPKPRLPMGLDDGDQDDDDDDEKRGKQSARHNNYRFDDRSLSGHKGRRRDEDGLMNIIIASRIDIPIHINLYTRGASETKSDFASEVRRTSSYSYEPSIKAGFCFVKLIVILNDDGRINVYL